ncbi:hypothetical protein TRFO_21322 [Tritrichomonas foetus]|uniref:Uncharacterized protein n=1 Tax=Tritrichomonas foetus TaxID=1144522 RepID=A0A1J4KEU6_9EUKA|nr:hypothetical protein TRFO_21322 [Tritrichomonas foetus]|eukprot:OHT09699.1 hypothetical protein TRFO_21322 [Tritrichomonas foetus]
MRKTKSPFIISAPLLIHDPMTGESKINTDKWNTFLIDIRNESHNFKETFERASYDKVQVNNAYKKSSQLSFNAIHNVKRKVPPPEHAVPRVPHPKPKEEPEMKSTDPFNFETIPANNYCWPKRASTAFRYLNPSKLHTIYGVQQRKRDPYVLAGEHINENEAY